MSGSITRVLTILSGVLVALATWWVIGWLVDRDLHTSGDSAADYLEDQGVADGFAPPPCDDAMAGCGGGLARCSSSPMSVIGRAAFSTGRSRCEERGSLMCVPPGLAAGSSGQQAAMCDSRSRSVIGSS